MGAKLTQDIPGGIKMIDMPPDRVAVVTSGVYAGSLVQKRDKDIVIIGHDNGWTHPYGGDTRVRLLEPGETITIT